MPPTLYHVPKTISSPIYQALLELNVVDKPVKVETLTFAQLKSPEHLARNPMGTSPAFTDEEHDIAIWESGAVLTYLLDLYDKDFALQPQPGKSLPSQRANFLHLQQYILATVYPFVATLYIHTLKRKEDQDQAYVENSKDKWRTLLAPTLIRFLGDAPYFMGETLSVIDLLAAKPLNNVNSMGMLSEFPTLHAVFQKVYSLPSFAKAYSAPEEAPCIECRSMLMIPGNSS
jgi:glutathione S-transferase